MDLSRPEAIADVRAYAAAFGYRLRIQKRQWPGSVLSDGPEANSYVAKYHSFITVSYIPFSCIVHSVCGHGRCATPQTTRLKHAAMRALRIGIVFGVYLSMAIWGHDGEYK